jgi:two-component system phosphate regulon response regulator PhoB
MGGINSQPNGSDSRVPQKKTGDTIDPSPEGRSATPGPDRAVPPAAGKSILIIEDDQTTQNIIRHFLEKNGFAVASAGDAEEGLRQARDKPPALIILDLMLPGMSGFQVLSRLKQDAALAPIPVVILSSLTQEDDIMKALTSGAADYITKPLSPIVLVTKIKLLLTERS